MSSTTAVPVTLEALAPRDIAQKAVSVGVSKAHGHPVTTFALAVLAGMFVALGAMFATVAVSVSPHAVGLPYGFSKLLMGCAFSVGLVLVVVGGAELFTSNVLLVLAWATGRVEGSAVLRNWAIVYLGNFLGASATAVLIVISQQYRSADGGVGYAALHLADGKGELGFVRALVLGVLCNILVCLAVWLSYSARTTVDRIVAVVPPVAAFVAAGFEHSVANMYFLPLGAMIKTFAPESFWSSIQADAGNFTHVGWQPFLANLLPVTIGNLIGGALIVGGLYWMAYLRPLTPGRRTTTVPPQIP